MTSHFQKHDFLDFGASKGGCIQFALKKLGGTCGLGIDINPEKVRQMTQLGYECILGDVTELIFPPKSFRFVTMSHVLEHLPDLSMVEKAIKSAAGVASDFLFIQGPYFDADDFLKSRGLKFFWSDWSGHKCHLTTWQLQKILSDLELNDHLIMVREVVGDSISPFIHPLNSPRNQHEYVKGLHPEKPFEVFDPPLYQEIVCYVRLRPFKDWEKVVKARRGCFILTKAGIMRPQRSNLLFKVNQALKRLLPLRHS